MNKSKYTQEYKESILNEFPKFRKLHSRILLINDLRNEVDQEANLELKVGGLNIIVRMMDRLYAEVIELLSREYSTQFNEMNNSVEESLTQAAKNEEISRQLAETLQEERIGQEDFYKDFCACMILDPRGTFENIILKQVERYQKINSLNGFENWQWTLRFPLLARIRMAFNLITGCKDITS